MNQNLEVLFQKKYGYSEKESKSIIKKVSISNEELIQNRMKFYKEYFNLTNKQLSDLILSFPALLGYGEKYIIEKNDFLIKALNLTNNQVTTLLTSVPSLFGLKNQVIEEKISSLKQSLNLKDNELSKVILQRPQLLTLNSERATQKLNLLQDSLNFSDDKFDKAKTKLGVLLGRNNDSILKNIQFYKKNLTLSEDKLSKILISNPNLLNFSQDYILDKIEFLKNILKISNKEVILIFNSFPSIIYGNKGSIKDKIEFLKNLFDISIDQLKDFIIKHSKILGYDKEKLILKIENFSKIGLKKETILENPILLSAPPDKIVLRYAIGSANNLSINDFIKYNLFIISEDKLYAKLKFLKDPSNAKWLNRSESDFSKHFLTSGDSLIKIYPLTSEMKINLIENFENKNKNDNNEKN